VYLQLRSASLQRGKEGAGANGGRRSQSPERGTGAHPVQQEQAPRPTGVYPLMFCLCQRKSACQGASSRHWGRVWRWGSSAATNPFSSPCQARLRVSLSPSHIPGAALSLGSAPPCKAGDVPCGHLWLGLQGGGILLSWPYRGGMPGGGCRSEQGHHVRPAG